MGNVKTKFSGTSKRKAFRYLDQHPKRYRECIRDLNLQFVVDPSTLRRLYKDDARSKAVAGANKADEERETVRAVVGDEVDSANARDIRDTAQVRQTLQAVMEFMGSTKVASFSEERLDWKRINLCGNLCDGRQKMSIKRQWGRIAPVLSRHCAGVSLNTSGVEVPILQHLRDTADSLEEVDVSGLKSSFPFENDFSLSDLVAKARKKMAKLSETEDDGDFKSKMNALIKGWPKSGSVQQNARINMIVRVYKEVAKDLETKWAEEKQAKRS